MSRKTGRSRRLRLYDRGNTACPICLMGFTRDQAASGRTITLEHVPIKALGGQARCLTCRNCNAETGRGIDQAAAKQDWAVRVGSSAAETSSAVARSRCVRTAFRSRRRPRSRSGAGQAASGGRSLSAPTPDPDAERRRDSGDRVAAPPLPRPLVEHVSEETLKRAVGHRGRRSGADLRRRQRLLDAGDGSGELTVPGWGFAHPTATMRSAS